ncbi:MAG: pectate lyase, partial [Candidatus Binatia bacterium]
MAGSVRARSSSACRRWRGALLLAATLVARRAGGEPVTDELDALARLQRPAGGWVFAAPPGTRPEPFTLVVKTAEHWLAPLGLAGWDLVVVRSPGTPAAGLVLLEGYHRTGRATYLDGARRTGDFLLATQLAPGGWFSELPVYGATEPWWFRRSAGLRPMLDDDITPGATRFLLALWEATGDARYRAGAERAIDLLLRSQLPSGAWPLDARPAWLRRVHPTYEDQPALNDGATPFAVTTLVAAAAKLGRPE